MSAVPVPRRETAGGPRPVPQVESITPEKAAQYLKTMVANRPVSPSRAVEYALEMEAGKWILNGETIKFDAKGNLIDGQHRLEACLLAKKPFITWVIRGVEDPLAFATIDVGKTRTHGDLFALKGYNNQAHAASAATLLYYWKKGLLKKMPGPHTEHSLKRRRMVAGSKYAGKSVSTHSIPKEDLLVFAEPFREKIAEALKAVDNMKLTTRIMPRSTAAALLVLFSEKDYVEALQFMKRVGSGEGLARKDPEYVLRERLMEAHRKEEARLTRWALVLMTIKAWNARRDGRYIQILKVIPDEEFPKIK